MMINVLLLSHLFDQNGRCVKQQVQGETRKTKRETEPMSADLRGGLIDIAKELQLL